MPQAATPPRQRRHLHFDALVQLVRQRFARLPEQRRCPDFSLTDTLTAGLALFSLKDSSLLAFCRRARDHNLRSVFGLQAIPSDTQLRTIPPSRRRGGPHATPGVVSLWCARYAAFSASVCWVSS